MLNDGGNHMLIMVLSRNTRRSIIPLSVVRITAQSSDAFFISS